jgi:hypothetical protein
VYAHSTQAWEGRLDRIRKVSVTRSLIFQVRGIQKNHATKRRLMHRAARGADEVNLMGGASQPVRIERMAEQRYKPEMR